MYKKQVFLRVRSTELSGANVFEGTLPRMSFLTEG